MITAYSPIYPKLIHRFVNVMGGRGMENFANDCGLTILQLEEFAKTNDISPIAEHIPVMYGKLFGTMTPIQALQLCEENNV